MEKNLIIFIKNPVLGTVKTRLAKSIGDPLALEVYKDLMCKCREETMAVDASRYLFYSNRITNDEWPKNSFIKFLQDGGDLGNRINSAFYAVQEGKENKTLIIGSDCFDLTTELIEEAFEKLNNVDLVIGPANDGGYYLLGTKKYHPFLFENISWSTPSVFFETINKAKKNNLSFSSLIELVDIDTLEDLNQSSYDLTQIKK